MRSYTRSRKSGAPGWMLQRITGIALIILTIGLIAAWLLGYAVERLLRIIRLDQLSDRFGMSAALARGGLQHRPINPAKVAFSEDPLVNSLALDSLYSVGFEAYSLRHESVSSAVYGTQPEAEMNALVCASAGLEGPALESRLPSLHHQKPVVARARPMNLVLIVEESLGARFVGSLGGAALQP